MENIPTSRDSSRDLLLTSLIRMHKAIRLYTPALVGTVFVRYAVTKSKAAERVDARIASRGVAKGKRGWPSPGMYKVLHAATFEK